MKTNEKKTNLTDSNMEFIEESVKILASLKEILYAKKEMAEIIDLAFKSFAVHALRTNGTIYEKVEQILNATKSLIEKKYNFDITIIEEDVQNKQKALDCKKETLSKSKIIN